MINYRVFDNPIKISPNTLKFQQLSCIHYFLASFDLSNKFYEIIIQKNEVWILNQELSLEWKKINISFDNLSTYNNKCNTQPNLWRHWRAVIIIYQNYTTMSRLYQQNTQTKGYVGTKYIHMLKLMSTMLKRWTKLFSN